MPNMFWKKKEKPATPPVADETVAPSEPDSFVLLERDEIVYYTVRDPWDWVLKELSEEALHMQRVEKPADLPSTKQATISTSTPPATPRRRRKKTPGPCTLRFEIEFNGEIIESVHGCSEAFDGLEDKDELVRTIQRCRCEHLELSPPSKLLNWDVTREECMNLVGESLPGLLSNDGKGRIAVLKEPMGSRGTGVFFVKNAQEILEIIEEHRKRAVDEPEFLDNLIAMKGRIPSWVLQAEVSPCLLVRGRHKFHVRAYVAAVEQLDSDDELLESYVFNRQEVRIASHPIPEEDTEDRNRESHITNGAMADSTERVLLQDVPDLVERNLQDKIELFVAQTFGKHFVPDMERRVSVSATNEETSNPPRKFAIAALDIMVTQDGRLYLLEVNVNPAAPPREAITDVFHSHLVGFMKDLMTLAVGNPTPNFVSSRAILARHG